MDLNQKQSDLLRHLAPQLEETGLKTKIWMTILTILILIGGYSLLRQITEGHGITGMRDHVVWGLYIANFIFFIGISYAGAIIAASLHLFKVPWRRPIIRISALIALVSGIIGPVFILLCIGRFDRLHHLFIHGRLQSPITWDVVAIMTYLVGAFLFVYFMLIKDFATLRDDHLLNIPKWKHKIYRILALNYQDTPEQQRQIFIAKNLLAIIIIPMVVIVSSVLSWIFGMTLRPGWHSSIFGPYFVIASILTGIGVVIIMMWYFRYRYKLKDYLTDHHFKYMGYIMLVFASAYGYFTFSELLTSWYGSEKWDSEVVHKLFSIEEYGYWTIFSIFFAIVLPIIVMAIPKLRRTNLIATGAFLMVIAMWIRRYLIVVPTLETPLLPMQDTRLEYIHYTPTWPEWALTIGGVASFFLFFMIATRFITIISLSEYSKTQSAEKSVILKSIES